MAAKKKVQAAEECKHPLNRQFGWVVEDPTRIKKRGNFLERRGAVICVGCCQCGTVLHGAAR